MSPNNVKKVFCPLCGARHNNKYVEDSNWCTPCAEDMLKEQAEDDNTGPS